MPESAGFARYAAKGYGKSMVKLNSSQIKMRENFLVAYTETRRADLDTSEFCFLCDQPGDNRQKDSMFSTVIPCICPGHPERGLKMDAIYGIWICARCVKDLK